MSRWALLAAAGLLAAGLPVRAVPPDRIVEMKAGEEMFVPAGQGAWQARSEDSRVAEAAGAAGGEIHLRARGRGRTLVLVENRKVGRLAVWLVLVDEKPPERPDFDDLPCACSRPDPEEPPLCLVTGRSCLLALRKALAAGGTTTGEAWIRLDTKGIQALLAEMRQRLGAAGFSRVEPVFAGANLRLQGRVENEEERARLIFELYRLMVGRLILEDKLQVGEHRPEPEPDDGR